MSNQVKEIVSVPNNEWVSVVGEVLSNVNIFCNTTNIIVNLFFKRIFFKDI